MHPMGYSSFGQGFARGLGLYQDIRKANIMEEEVALQRERQALSQDLEMKKTEAYLKSLDQQTRLSSEKAEREKLVFDRALAAEEAGKIASTLRTIEGIEDTTLRKNTMKMLANKINGDERLRGLLGLTPDRQIEDVMQVVNPKTKKPAYTLVVKNASLDSTGPMTPSGAKFGQEPAVIFDIDMLERISGTPRKEPRYVNTTQGLMTEEDAAARGLQEASPKSSNPRTLRTQWVNTSEGIMPAEQAYSLGLPAWSLSRSGAGGAGGVGRGDFSANRKDFYQAFPNVRPGKTFNSYDEVSEYAKIAREDYGLYLKFNQTPDPTGGKNPTYYLVSVTGQNPEQITASGAGSTTDVKMYMLDGELMIEDPSTGKLVDYDTWKSGVKPSGSSGGGVGVKPEEIKSPAKSKSVSDGQVRKWAFSIMDKANQNPERTRQWIKENYGEDVLNRVDKEVEAQRKKKGTMTWKGAAGGVVSIDLGGSKGVR